MAPVVVDQVAVAAEEARIFMQAILSLPAFQCAVQQRVSSAASSASGASAGACLASTASLDAWSLLMESVGALKRVEDSGGCTSDRANVTRSSHHGHWLLLEKDVSTLRRKLESPLVSEAVATECTEAMECFLQFLTNHRRASEHAGTGLAEGSCSAHGEGSALNLTHLDVDELILLSNSLVFEFPSISTLP